MIPMSGSLDFFCPPVHSHDNSTHAKRDSLLAILNDSDSIGDLVKLSFFTDIGKAITSARTMKATLDEVMNQIGKIFAPTYWSLLLRNQKTGNLRFSVVVGSGVESLKGVELSRGKGVAGWIAENGKAVIIEDVSRDERFSDEMDELTKFTTRSIIGVPLKTGEKVFGVIELINAADRKQFSALELQLLATIGDFTAIAVERLYYLRALRKIATIDPLTGLHNRRSFHTYIERESERAKRSGCVFSLLMIDVDDFKQINDTYGHPAGDEVLRTIGNLLLANVRKADFAVRYGGDEFVIIMPETPRSEAARVKDRIESTIKQHNAGSEINISLSMGIRESDGNDTKEIMDLVDKSMYAEKSRKQERHIDNIGENLEDFLAEE